MRIRINTGTVTYFILYGALLLIYSCGFTFLQTYQLYALLASSAILVFMFVYTNKMRIKRKNLVILLFAIYVIIGMLAWGVEKDKLTLMLYITALLTSVLYVVNDISNKPTEMFFRIIQYVALFEAITIFFSVVIPGLMPQKFGFLYRQLVIDTMNKDLRRGIYSGFIGEKAAAAYLLNLGLAYTLSFLNVNNRIDKKKLLLSVVLFLAILFTGKRMLLLTAVFMFLASLLAGRSLKNKIRAIGIIGVGIIILVLFVKYVPAASITFQRFMLTESYDTMNGREDMWISALKIFENNKIIGCGYGSYQSVSGSIYNGHNSYLQLLAETGILGCAILSIIFVTTIIYAIRNLHKNKSTMNYLALNLLILTFLYAYTGNVFHTSYQLITFFVAIAITNYSQEKNVECKKVEQ